MRNEDIPIGFTMELAQHENALSAFSSLTNEQQRQVIDEAKNMKTRQEMRNYVENQFINRGKVEWNDFASKNCYAGSPTDPHLAKRPAVFVITILIHDTKNSLLLLI